MPPTKYFFTEFPPNGVGDSKLKLATIGSKAQHLAKAFRRGLIKPPPTNHSWCGPWPHSMSVSVISQRYLLRRLSTKHCNTQWHVMQCSTSWGVSAFYRQPRMHGRSMQINKRSAQGPGRRCQRTVLSLGRLTKRVGWRPRITALTY